MQMMALKAHRYGIERKAGDQFEVRATHVRLMKALGWQAEAPPLEVTPTPEPKPRRTYTRKIVQAEATVPAPAKPAVDAPAEGAGEPEPEPVHRTYHRRDLVAEGE